MMLFYLLQVVLWFVIAIVAIRLLGKISLGQVTPHDMIAIVMIAALATKPILVDDRLSILLAIGVMVVTHRIYTRFTLFQWSNRIIIGEPTILIKHGKVVRENLRESHLSLIELLSAIRVKGYPDLRCIAYAILEPTGEISVLPWDQYYPVTPKDLNLDIPYRGLAISLVVDGVIQSHNLQLIGKDEEWLRSELQKKGFTDLSKVMYASKQDHEPDIYVDNGEGTQR